MQFHDVLADFDRAIRQGDAGNLEAFFAEDARLFWHHEQAIDGRAAIGAAYRDLFDAFDTSDYEPAYDSIEVHGDAAYALAEFRETLRRRQAGPSLLVRGRSVFFWRRESDGAWRVTRLLTGRSAPTEEL